MERGAHSWSKGMILLQALVIVALGFWIYGPALQGAFIGDDDVDITQNTLVHSPAGLGHIWLHPGFNPDYFPIKATVQWIQWHLWGGDTLGYHVTNVILHVVSALLAWKVFARLGLRFAWLGGLIFVIHPVQVESVAWIAELKNTLSMPPFLLAVCAYIDYDEYRRSRDYFAALAFFLVAMLCKTTMVMFPFVILLYAWWKRGGMERHDLRASAPFFLISLILGLTGIYAGIRFGQFHLSVPDGMPAGGFLSRLACAGLCLGFYFWHFLWPVGLMPAYPMWNVNPPSPWQFLPWLALGGVAFWAWKRRRGWGRHIVFGLGFFILNLSLFLGFFSISYMSFTWVMDHFLYLPMLGLIGLLIAGLESLDRHLLPFLRVSGACLLALVVAILAWGSHRYAAMFVDSYTLWSYTAERNPGAWVAHNNLGRDLENRGQTAQAITQLEQAIQLNPDYGQAHDNLGIILGKIGRISDAIRELREAVRLQPTVAAIHTTLGTLLLRNGQVSEAAGQFQQALLLNPNDTEANNNLGVAWQMMGRLPEAIEQYKKALDIDPGYMEAYNDWGIALQKLGRGAGGNRSLSTSLAHGPRCRRNA